MFYYFPAIIFTLQFCEITSQTEELGKQQGFSS